MSLNFLSQLSLQVHMTLQELLNAKVSDIITTSLIKDIETLKDMQNRIDVLTKSKKSAEHEGYYKAGNKAIDLIGCLMVEIADFAEFEFRDSIAY